MLKYPIDREQLVMFNRVDDFISENHSVRVIDILVDSIMNIKMKEYLINFKGNCLTGRPAYPASIMMKLYIYGCMNRINSSRRLEVEAHRNIELIWLLGSLKPDFKTIANFRKDHQELISEFAKQVRLFLRGSNLANNLVLAVDGTKLKANACRAMLTKKEVLEQLEKIEVYITELSAEDKIDDEQNEQKLKLICSKQEHKINKLEAKVNILKQALKQFEANPKKKKISLTDMEANEMRDKGDHFPSFNAQIASDTTNGFVMYDGVTTEANDINQAKPAVEIIKNELGQQPQTLLADSGYCNFDDIQNIENSGTECFVSSPKPQNKFPDITFKYDIETDVYICSENKTLTLKHKNKKSKNSFVNVYVGTACLSCPMKEKCTKSIKGRHISRYLNQEYRENHRQKMETIFAKLMLIRRKASVERVFGTMKLWLGKIPILTRGRVNVANEVKLFCVSYNVKRLMNLFTVDQFKGLINAYLGFNPSNYAIFWFFNRIIIKLSVICYIVHTTDNYFKQTKIA